MRHRLFVIIISWLIFSQRNEGHKLARQNGEGEKEDVVAILSSLHQQLRSFSSEETQWNSMFQQWCENVENEWAVSESDVKTATFSSVSFLSRSEEDLRSRIRTLNADIWELEGDLSLLAASTKELKEEQEMSTNTYNMVSEALDMVEKGFASYENEKGVLFIPEEKIVWGKVLELATNGKEVTNTNSPPKPLSDTLKMLMGEKEQATLLRKKEKMESFQSHIRSALIENDVRTNVFFQQKIRKKRHIIANKKILKSVQNLKQQLIQTGKRIRTTCETQHSDMNKLVDFLKREAKMVEKSLEQISPEAASLYLSKIGKGGNLSFLQVRKSDSEVLDNLHLLQKDFPGEKAIYESEIAILKGMDTPSVVKKKETVGGEKSSDSAERLEVDINSLSEEDGGNDLVGGGRDGTRVDLKQVESDLLNKLSSKKRNIDSHASWCLMLERSGDKIDDTADVELLAASAETLTLFGSKIDEVVVSRGKKFAKSLQTIMQGLDVLYGNAERDVTEFSHQLLKSSVGENMVFHDLIQSLERDAILFKEQKKEMASWSNPIIFGDIFEVASHTISSIQDAKDKLNQELDFQTRNNNNDITKMMIGHKKETVDDDKSFKNLLDKICKGNFISDLNDLNEEQERIKISFPHNNMVHK